MMHLVGSLQDLREDRLMIDLPDGEMVLVVRHADVVYAVDAMCPHQYAPLIGGDVENCVLICPMHGWRFDLRNGVDPGNPWVRLRTYPVELRGDEIWVELIDEAT